MVQLLEGMLLQDKKQLLFPPSLILKNKELDSMTNSKQLIKIQPIIFNNTLTIKPNATLLMMLSLLKKTNYMPEKNELAAANDVRAVKIAWPAPKTV